MVLMIIILWRTGPATTGMQCACGLQAKPGTCVHVQGSRQALLSVGRVGFAGALLAPRPPPPTSPGVLDLHLLRETSIAGVVVPHSLPGGLRRDVAWAVTLYVLRDRCMPAILARWPCIAPRGTRVMAAVPGRRIRPPRSTARRAAVLLRCGCVTHLYLRAAHPGASLWPPPLLHPPAMVPPAPGHAVKSHAAMSRLPQPARKRTVHPEGGVGSLRLRGARQRFRHCQTQVLPGCGCNMRCIVLRVQRWVFEGVRPPRMVMDLAQAPMWQYTHKWHACTMAPKLVQQQCWAWHQLHVDAPHCLIRTNKVVGAPSSWRRGKQSKLQVSDACALRGTRTHARSHEDASITTTTLPAHSRKKDVGMATNIVHMTGTGKMATRP